MYRSARARAFLPTHNGLAINFMIQEQTFNQSIKSLDTLEERSEYNTLLTQPRVTSEKKYIYGRNVRS